MPSVVNWLNQCPSNCFHSISAQQLPCQMTAIKIKNCTLLAYCWWFQYNVLPLWFSSKQFYFIWLVYFGIYLSTVYNFMEDDFLSQSEPSSPFRVFSGSVQVSREKKQGSRPDHGIEEQINWFFIRTSNLECTHKQK